MVTVLPSFVIGPSLSPELCSTASDVLGLLKGIDSKHHSHLSFHILYMVDKCSLFHLTIKTGETEKFKWHGRMGYVHIDDVAACHILVYEHKTAHGRFLCSSTVLDNNELASFLSAKYPSLPIPKRFIFLLF